MKNAIDSKKRGGGGGLTPYPSLKSADMTFKPAWLRRFSCQQNCADKNADSL
jgi:hypothetical protein